MTNLNNLVTSLELSKSLKEAGLVQKSLFYWDEYIKKIVCWHYKEEQEKEDTSGYVSAYTSGELGFWLPAEIETKDNYFALDITKINLNDSDKSKWGIIYSNKKIVKDVCPLAIVHDETLIAFIEESLSECMGKMLLYLIESGLILLKKI